MTPTILASIEEASKRDSSSRILRLQARAYPEATYVKTLIERKELPSSGLLKKKVQLRQRIFNPQEKRKIASMIRSQVDQFFEITGLDGTMSLGRARFLMKARRVLGIKMDDDAIQASRRSLNLLDPTQ